VCLMARFRLADSRHPSASPQTAQGEPPPSLTAQIYVRPPSEGNRAVNEGNRGSGFGIVHAPIVSSIR